MEMSHQHTAGILTLGCKVNQYESHAMAEALTRAGVAVRPFSQCCDLYIINTCTVTAESDRKARQMIRRAIKQNPAAFVLVCGCGVQHAPQLAASIEGVDFICGTRNKMAVVDRALDLLARGCKPAKPEIVTESLDGAAFEPMSVSTFDRVRAFLKIEDGCSGKCAYCIIPRVRGPVSSKHPDDVVREAQTLISSGCREIILTGIETSAYQYDLPELLSRIDKIDGIERIRLSSLDPASMKPEFIDRIAALTHFAPHFHVSLQSGCTRTLLAMRRRYTAETAYRNMEYIRTVIPRVQFSADIITGFPGETEEDFLQTLAFVQQTRLLHAHIFTYSRRPGTAADTMPDQIPEEIKIERSARLSNLQKEIKHEILDAELAADRPTPVLIEEMKTGYFRGHSDHFMEYIIPATDAATDAVGKVLLLHPLSHDGDIITGRLS